MNSLHEVLRALIDAGHRTGGLSEEDYKAAHEWVTGDDPEAERLAAESAAAADEADRAEYERLQAKYAGQPEPAAPVAAAGGGFHQEPGTESAGFGG